MSSPISSTKSKKPVEPVKPIEWLGGPEGHLRLLDQTQLPHRELWIDCRTAQSVWDAIHDMKTRGAPLIGVSAAWGLYLGMRASKAANPSRFLLDLGTTEMYLASARPTASNLGWALTRMKEAAVRKPGASVPAKLKALWNEARAIHAEDEAMGAAIGKHGAKLMPDEGAVLTHCNAGSLATAGTGTALAVIYAAVAAGKKLAVFADETRPFLQGARLTAWELMRAGIPCTLLCDGAAARLMQEGKVQCVVVGADRIAANGDFANKIGTYGVALAAKEHDVPFYVAAPTSTVDRDTPGGSYIPVEERDPGEVTGFQGRRTAPEGVGVYNPSFDVVPARFAAAIITEKGVLRPPFSKAIGAL